MTVFWEPYLSLALQPVSAADLAQLEQEWGVALPGEYKDLVTACQGMAPTPDIFNVGKKSTNVFNVLLTIKRHEGYESYSIPRAYEVLRPHVPPGVFPFAKTPSGEFICFDYRDRPTDPQVVLVSVEMAVYPISNDFGSFLNGLHH
ncbi:SMI1/KNR4 family protein [Stigmatella sp. ncwal1]|uniref:SMI1/KNR4 family protein n=1 Tax=Stigmatella ashevillensis TaxID=2995309 RepID=A0ABT5DHI7_9BACT|nr:SMI1/KNR4 family protein [Stigmatella ashevillena]MDC0712986.1 SMI1/KNR4 family protein [Stigmatella ashevillena]